VNQSGKGVECPATYGGGRGREWTQKKSVPKRWGNDNGLNRSGSAGDKKVDDANASIRADRDQPSKGEKKGCFGVSHFQKEKVPRGGGSNGALSLVNFPTHVREQRKKDLTRGKCGIGVKLPKKKKLSKGDLNRHVAR